MRIKTTVVCLPVRDLDKTTTFYRDALGLTPQVEEGMITLELPNLSLFLMEKTAFEAYSKKAGRDARFPSDDAGLILSCAVETKEDVDAALQTVPKHGGSVPAQFPRAAIDEASGGYTGYFTDPDGYLWELVHPKPR